jgi:hypothetical protein
MGGPLVVTPEGGGYSHGWVSTYSLSVLDPDAPLAKWRRLGAFQSEDQCTSYRAEELKQLSDPAWASAQALKLHHLVDTEGTHDLIESAVASARPRCPADDQSNKTLSHICQLTYRMSPRRPRCAICLTDVGDSDGQG